MVRAAALGPPARRPGRDRGGRPRPRLGGRRPRRGRGRPLGDPGPPLLGALAGVAVTPWRRRSGSSRCWRSDRSRGRRRGTVLAAFAVAFLGAPPLLAHDRAVQRPGLGAGGRPAASRDGRRRLVTLHDIRNFDYRTETDFTPAYYDRTFDLRRLDALDLVTAYWMGPAIAHVFLSFGFGDDHVAVSVEARKERERGLLVGPGLLQAIRADLHRRRRAGPDPGADQLPPGSAGGRLPLPGSRSARERPAPLPRVRPRDQRAARSARGSTTPSPRTAPRRSCCTRASIRGTCRSAGRSC